jgi:hypothetical protein
MTHEGRSTVAAHSEIRLLCCCLAAAKLYHLHQLETQTVTNRHHSVQQRYLAGADAASGDSRHHGALWLVNNCHSIMNTRRQPQSLVASLFVTSGCVVL